MIRHYKMGDLEKIKLQPEQKMEKNDDWCFFESKDTLVFADGEKVLALVLPVHELGGRIHLAALVSADCGKKAVPCFKQMKRIIDGWLENKEALRVEMITQVCFGPANRLAQMLGFKLEGTLHKFFKGIDFNIWGRTE